MKLLFFLLFAASIQAQNLETFIKGGELLVTGISVFKTSKLNFSKEKVVDSKFVATVCVKNKLTEKIIVKFDGKDSEGTKVSKELVVQTDDKECVFDIPKGIYNYEIILANNEIFKKENINLKKKLPLWSIKINSKTSQILCLTGFCYFFNLYLFLF